MPARAASVCPSIRASRRGLRLRAVEPADEHAITRVHAAAIRGLTPPGYRLVLIVGMPDSEPEFAGSLHRSLNRNTRAITGAGAARDQAGQGPHRRTRRGHHSLIGTCTTAVDT